ncbi:MAG: response regulator transcription factor [Hyphomonas sp.]
MVVVAAKSWWCGPVNIILVEDDSDLIETIRLGWPDGADRIEAYTNFASFKPVLFSGGLTQADCVIVDMKLPDASGTQIIAEIQRVSDIPIIVLSGSGETEFRADLINRGIDDYVLKPLGVKELHARVARLVRRRSAPSVADSLPVKINAVTFDRSLRTLRAGAQQIELTHAECQLLGALVDAGQRVVPRDELYLKAFGRAHREGEKVLETYISRLRSKLEQLEAASGDAIQTARGSGYRIIAQTSSD